MLVRLSAVALAAVVLVAIVGPLLGLEPNRVNLPHMLQGPQAGAWFGYDELGRPLLDRVVSGARTSLLVAVAVVSLSLVLGTAIGTASAWAGGALDHVVVRIIDVFLAFPGILLAILYSCYVVLRCYLNSQLAPAMRLR